MSSFLFSSPDGKTFEVKVPQGTTLQQARAIFDQQVSTDGLVGFRVGDTLSAVTQAADGLASAKAALAQSVGSIGGALGSNVNLNTITASLGLTGAAVAQQVGASISGPLAGIASLTTGASAAINGAISGATAALSSGTLDSVAGIGRSASGLLSQATAQVSSALGEQLSTVLPATPSGLINSVLATPLTGAAGQLNSLASTAVDTLGRAISGLPTAAIGVADFIKQSPVVSGIANLSAPDVTSTLASVSKMVGQAPQQISNSLGIGKFGFDAQQLERAGVIKPGVAETFLSQNSTSLVGVLKSPTVWTGKDGVKNLQDLLDNENIQDRIQTNLMSSGLEAVKSVGVAVNSLTTQALSGVAVMAAKSVGDTVNFVKGLADSIPAPPGLPQLPGIDQLAPSVSSAFDAVAKNTAFAVSFSALKIGGSFKREVPVDPASNTVNTETVTAGGRRIVGNSKVPDIAAGDGSFSSAQEKVQAYLAITKTAFSGYQAAEVKVTELERASSVTQQQIEQIRADVAPVKDLYNAQVYELERQAREAVNALTDSDGKERLKSLMIRITTVIIPAYLEYVKIFNGRLKDLALKIA